MSRRRHHFIPPARRWLFVHICTTCPCISVNIDHALQHYRQHIDANGTRGDVHRRVLEAIAGALLEKGINAADVYFFTSGQHEKMPYGMCRRNARLAGLKLRRLQ